MLTEHAVTVVIACQVSQLQGQLRLERAARQDLEMHTEALVAQKTLTHQEILVLTQEVEKCKCMCVDLQVLVHCSL